MKSKSQICFIRSLNLLLYSKLYWFFLYQLLLDKYRISAFIIEQLTEWTKKNSVFERTSERNSTKFKLPVLTNYLAVRKHIDQKFKNWFILSNWLALFPRSLSLFYKHLVSIYDYYIKNMIWFLSTIHTCDERTQTFFWQSFNFYLHNWLGIETQHQKLVSMK